VCHARRRQRWLSSVSLDGFAWYRQTTPWDGNRSAGGLVDCTIIIGGNNRYRTSSRATLYRPGCARCRPDRLSLVHGLFHSSSLRADPYPTVPVHSIIIYVVALSDLHTLRCSCKISYSLPVFGGIPGVGHVSSGAWASYILATIVGGVTCLIGSLTKHMFKPAI